MIMIPTKNWLMQRNNDNSEYFTTWVLHLWVKQQWNNDNDKNTDKDDKNSNKNTSNDETNNIITIVRNLRHKSYIYKSYTIK
jgi:hypothetical protein